MGKPQRGKRAGTLASRLCAAAELCVSARNYAAVRRALNPSMPMITLLPVAAIGFSLVYLLFGGGIFGAIIIFIIAKIFRK